MGKITAAREPIERGATIVPRMGRIGNVNPIPGPSAIEAIISVDREVLGTFTAQQKLAFINRGSNDGIAPGMVFRSYYYKDQHTGQKLTSSDLVFHADCMVVHVTPAFSTALIIRGADVIENGTPAVLLTDVSDLIKIRKSDVKILERPGEKEKTDELDELDKTENGNLGTDEEKELKQLEKWKEGEPPAPEGTQPPSDQPLPGEPQPPAQEPGALPEEPATEVPSSEPMQPAPDQGLQPLPDEIPPPAEPLPTPEPPPPPSDLPDDLIR
jgi:hypothetical protein